MLKNILDKISPMGFYFFSTKVIPWLLLLSLALISYGLYLGLFIAPEDYQQGYISISNKIINLDKNSAAFILQGAIDYLTNS